VRRAVRITPLSRLADIFGDHRTAALLLVAYVALAASPLSVADQLWIGSAMTGEGLAGDVLFVALGVAVFAGGAIPVVLLAAAVGIWRGARAAWLPALIALLLSAAATAGPFHSAALVSWIPGGRIVIVVMALLALMSLILSRRGLDPEASVGRAFAFAALPLAAVFVSSAGIAFAADGLPSAPSGLFASDFEGSGELTGEPLRVDAPYDRPGLAAGQGSNIHNDPGMSDLYVSRSAIDPEDAELTRFKAPGDCASLLFDERGRIVAICVSLTKVVAHLLDPATLEPLASSELAERELSVDLLTTFSGGGYAALDAAGRIVIGTSDGQIMRYSVDPGEDASIREDSSFDVSDALAADEPINSALPDSRKRIWFVGAEGTVGVLDPDSGEATSLFLEDTEIENSFALAPNGDAFVVTSHELMRLRAAGEEIEVVWRESYDRGERAKPGQSSRGSGTTPTVMLGGKYVTIADNAEQMKVLVYEAGVKADGPRLVCSEQVFEDGESATENSLVVAGRSIFVENNYGYKLFDVLGGHSSEPGAARIDLNAEGTGCEKAWENDDVHIPSAVSKVSAADGTFLTYTHPPSPMGVDAWYFTALDAGTGEVLWERLAGAGPLMNNHYAAVYLGPDGRIYVGTLGGVVALL
jgi:outer membrane protein assembly factor BamB